MKCKILYLLLAINSVGTGCVKTKPGTRLNESHKDSLMLSKEVVSVKQLSVNQPVPENALVEKIGLEEIAGNRLIFFRKKSKTLVFVNLFRRRNEAELCAVDFLCQPVTEKMTILNLFKGANNYLQYPGTTHNLFFSGAGMRLSFVR